MFFHPEKAEQVWGEALRAGYAKRDPQLGPLTSWSRPAWRSARTWTTGLPGPNRNLYLGGMGARGRTLPRAGHPLRFR